MCIYMYIYIYILFQILFHYRLLQDIDYSSYIVLSVTFRFRDSGCLWFRILWPGGPGLRGSVNLSCPGETT